MMWSGWATSLSVPRSGFGRRQAASHARDAISTLSALDASSLGSPAFAGRESRRARGAGEHRVAAEPRLEREPVFERQADSLERRATIREHRALRELRQALGDLERPVEL